jgi:hypothetical protein
LQQRYRSHGEPAITVQNVSVGDGGKPIVANITQHASVIVSDKNPASAARKAPKAAGLRWCTAIHRNSINQLAGDRPSAVLRWHRYRSNLRDQPLHQRRLT